MPRPKKVDAPHPKQRSRKGCWPCKARKVKCDEAHPSCLNCQRQGEACDYSIRLNWEGRGKKKPGGDVQAVFSSSIGDPASEGLGAEDSEPVEDEKIHNAAIELQSGLPVFESRVTRADADADIKTAIPTYIGYGPVDPPQRSLEFPKYGPHPNSEAAVIAAVIDPALMEYPNTMVPDYQTTPYDRIPAPLDQLYAQSYERYHSGAENTLRALRQSPLARIRDAPTRQNGFTSPSGSRQIHASLSVEGNDVCSDRPSKRSRYNSPGQEGSGPSFLDMPPPHQMSNITYVFSANNTPITPVFPMGTPLTLTSSLADNEDGYKIYSTKLSPHVTHEPPDPRRLSVESLLSGPLGIPYQHNRGYGGGPISDMQTHLSTSSESDMTEEMTTCGVDRGFPDLDIGKNDDSIAISGGSPLIGRSNFDLVIDGQDNYAPNEFGFGVQAKNTEFQKGNYYARPVTIKIPRSFEPLPSALLKNPMNLLYFHHFISHTARILVPHHCSANPFQNILPKMALQDPNLMNLLLAYSASHRARLLHQHEPATRIALWVKDIFPNLRHALDDPTKVISNSNLATAIMLTSLEIISPKAFGVAVPWQQHLDTARQILVWRGKYMQHDSSAVSNFLLRWFAYIDVLGSLTGGRAQLSSSIQKPLSPGYSKTDNRWTGDYNFDEDSDFQIDCLLGFTSRCVSILAKIAKLATICDRERIEANGNIRPKWAPSEEIRTQAGKLRIDLEAARTNNQVRPCPHLHSAGEAAYRWDTQEMAATNEAYHWAGLIHLDRRILGKPSTHHDVQNAVQEISGTLYKVRKGSTAEVCLLFPMFTAGCDAQDEGQKALVMDRLKGIEEFGMSHVHKARTLMRKVWDTGKPWETLVSGEFVG